MTTYYELLTDGSIGQNTISQKVALALGLNLSSEKEIVIGYDGKYYFEGEEPPKSLELAKQEKYSQNEQKRKVEYITTTFGRIKTQTPLGDLKTALPLYEKLSNVNAGLAQGAIRFYDEQGNVWLSPELSVAQVEAVIIEIAQAYMQIDQQSTQYSQSIANATSLEELDNIVIEYEV